MNHLNKECFAISSMPFLVLFAPGMAIIKLTFTPAATEATAQPIGNNTVIPVCNTTTVDPSSEVESMTTAFGQPFYVSNNTNDTEKEAACLEPQQTKDSHVAQVFIKRDMECG
jgi:hypothetical protein